MLIKIQVKRNIAIPGMPGMNVRTQELKAGVHTIDDSLLKHWFVESLIKRGDVIVVNKKTVSAPVVEPVATKQIETMVIGGPSYDPEKPVIKEEPKEEIVIEPEPIEEEIARPKVLRRGKK